MSKRRERDERRKRRTVKLEIPEDTKDELYALAAEYGVPISQMAALLFEHGYEAIRNGEVDIAQYLTDSGAPQLFKHNIDLKKFLQNLKKKK